jgi:hypothetical protein
MDQSLERGEEKKSENERIISNQIEENRKKARFLLYVNKI